MPSNLRRYDEPGHVHFWTITCYRRLGFFHLDGMKRIVIDGLALLQRKFDICLIAYVVMPEHVHVPLYPHPRKSDKPTPISRLLLAFKRYVGFYGKEKLRDYWRANRRLWSEPLNDWTQGRFDRQTIWSPRGYDFNVDRQETLLQKIDYCHKNPITRGLADSPEQWRWSSYRYFELDDRSVLPMDWDGQWPIVW